MTQIFFKGEAIPVAGELPAVGSKAPPFSLTDKSLKERDLEQFRGKQVILNIFPSLDTPTCAASVRAFNRAATHLHNTVVLAISMDLPFAQTRYCGAEGIQDVVTLSAFRHPEFGMNYGVTIQEGPMKGLLSRAVLVLDEEGKVLYTEHVKEITQEPDYPTALAACAS